MLKTNAKLLSFCRLFGQQLFYNVVLGFDYLRGYWVLSEFSNKFMSN